MTYLTVLIVFPLFFLLTGCLIFRMDYRGISVVLLAICTVTAGEALNLFVFRMAVYSGGVGIPAYIILAGAMISWGIFKLVQHIAWNRGTCGLADKLKILLLISLFLPLLEIAGLKSGLWHWTRPWPIISIGWYLGVWKFYVPVLLTPVVLGIVLDSSVERYTYKSILTKR